MRAKGILASLALLAAVFPALAATPAPQKKDYLSEAEADKIRDAGSTGPKIKLFVEFAADRIKKIQYELAHIDPADHKVGERINNFLNGYIGCTDDAADLVDLGVQKQEDIREGVKEMQARLKEFLPYLQSLESNGYNRDDYKDNLDDAIESTQDAMKDVEKAMKDMAPPPVRRKPG